MSLSVTTAFAMVYEPNTDIPTEEITSDSRPVTLAARANAEGQWQHNSTGWWWEYPDGTYPTNKWEQINNYWYYFNQDGYMWLGWLNLNSEWYYLNPGEISAIPQGAMATGWQSIYSDNYEKDFDYFFGPSGDMTYSPSEMFITYGHVFDDIDTVARAQEESDYLKSKDIDGAVRLNMPASDVLNGYSYASPKKTYLNSGLFICNGHGGPGCAIFDNTTALAGELSGTDGNGYVCTKVKGHTMNNCKIALYFGCETGIVGSSANNNPGKGDLLVTTQNEGALAAFGFNKSVLHASDNKFAPALVKELAEGKSLTDAAKAAKSVVPLFDACRDYRIVGGDTKFIISASTYSENESYNIPQGETYEFYSEQDGYKEYVQVIDGIMTSDYYTVDPSGNIVDLRDEITVSDIEIPTATGSNARRNVQAMPFTGKSENVIDVFERINGEIRLVRITQTVVPHDGYNTLDIQVEDLETGESIPYEDILANY